MAGRPRGGRSTHHGVEQERGDVLGAVVRGLRAAYRHEQRHRRVDLPVALLGRVRVSPRVRANQNRVQTPALLKGLIFGADGRALSPTHCRRRGRLYRYYVAQRVLKGDAAAEDDGIVRRVSAAEIEAAVVGQVRELLRQPEVVVGTWLAARAEAPDLTEAETRDALERLDPLWDELFPAEQARIVRQLVERVEVGPAGADIRLRVAGLTNLVRDLGTGAPNAQRAAA
jgi:hypothetical protein